MIALCYKSAWVGRRQPCVISLGSGTDDPYKRSHPKHVACPGADGSLQPVAPLVVVRPEGSGSELPPVPPATDGSSAAPPSAPAAGGDSGEQGRGADPSSSGGSSEAAGEAEKAGEEQSGGASEASTAGSSSDTPAQDGSGSGSSDGGGGGGGNKLPGWAIALIVVGSVAVVAAVVGLLAGRRLCGRWQVRQVAAGCACMAAMPGLGQLRACIGAFPLVAWGCRARLQLGWCVLAGQPAPAGPAVRATLLPSPDQRKLPPCTCAQCHTPLQCWRAGRHQACEDEPIRHDLLPCRLEVVCPTPTLPHRTGGRGATRRTKTAPMPPPPPTGLTPLSALQSLSWQSSVPWVPSSALLGPARPLALHLQRLGQRRLGLPRLALGAPPERRLEPGPCRRRQGLRPAQQAQRRQQGRRRTPSASAQRCTGMWCEQRSARCTQPNQPSGQLLTFLHFLPAPMHHAPGTMYLHCAWGIVFLALHLAREYCLNLHVCITVPCSRLQSGR